MYWKINYLITYLNHHQAILIIWRVRLESAAFLHYIKFFILTNANFIWLILEKKVLYIFYPSRNISFWICYYTTSTILVVLLVISFIILYRLKLGITPITDFPFLIYYDDNIILMSWFITTWVIYTIYNILYITSRMLSFILSISFKMFSNFPSSIKLLIFQNSIFRVEAEFLRILWLFMVCRRLRVMVIVSSVINLYLRKQYGFSLFSISQWYNHTFH